MKYSSMEDELRELKEKQGYKSEEVVVRDFEPSSAPASAERNFDAKTIKKEKPAENAQFNAESIKSLIKKISVPIAILTIVRLSLNGVMEANSISSNSTLYEIITVFAGLLKAATATILILTFIKIIKSQKTMKAGMSSRKVAAMITDVETTLDANKKITVMYRYNGKKYSTEKTVPSNSAAKKGDSFELYIDPKNPSNTISSTEFTQGNTVAIAILVVIFIFVFSFFMAF